MFEWPENILPLPSFSFGVDAEFANIRSRMDSGRIRQRPRFTQEVEIATVRFELTRNEYAAFKAIWVNSINQGNDWFNMRLPIADGQHLTPSEVRFISDYKANYRPGGNWDISAMIEFKDTSSLSEVVTQVLISEGFDTNEFETASENLRLEVAHFSANHPFK